MKAIPTLRWNPLKEMEDMQQRMTALHEVELEQLEHSLHEERLMAADWMPLVDITDNGHAYLIKADVPEMKKQDIKITCEDGVLTLTDECRGGPARLPHRGQREHGRFFRSFALPDDADPTHLAAEFKEGALVLRLPKNPTAHPKVLEVTIN